MDTDDDRTKNFDPTMKVKVDEQFEIRSGERIEGAMFSFVEHGTKKTTILNQLHPMHDSMLEQVRKEITEDNPLRQPLISLLTAWAAVGLSPQFDCNTRPHGTNAVRYLLDHQVRTCEQKCGNR